MTATPFGPYPSYVMFSYLSASLSPAAFLMMRSMLSFGTLLAFALAMQSFSFELEAGSGPPPSFTATASSRPILVKIFAFAPSVFSFLRLILFHLECPDISNPPKNKICWESQKCYRLSYHKTEFLASASTRRAQIWPIFPAFSQDCAAGPEFRHRRFLFLLLALCSAALFRLLWNPTKKPERPRGWQNYLLLALDFPPGSFL